MGLVGIGLWGPAAEVAAGFCRITELVKKCRSCGTLALELRKRLLEMNFDE
jgi:hypothetical protein